MSAALTDPLYDTSDVARVFEVSPSTVISWVRAELISPLRTVGGRRVYTQRDIEQLRRVRAEREVARQAGRAPTGG